MDAPQFRELLAAATQPAPMATPNVPNMIAFTQMALLDPSTPFSAKKTLFDAYTLHQTTCNDANHQPNASTLDFVTKQLQAGCANVIGGTKYGDYMVSTHLASTLGMPPPTAPTLNAFTNNNGKGRGNNGQSYKNGGRGRGRGKPAIKE